MECRVGIKNGGCIKREGGKNNDGRKREFEYGKHLVTSY